MANESESKEGFVVYITTPVIPSCFMAFFSDPYSPFAIFHYTSNNCIFSIFNISVSWFSMGSWYTVLRIIGTTKFLHIAKPSIQPFPSHTTAHNTHYAF